MPIRNRNDSASVLRVPIRMMGALIMTRLTPPTTQVKEFDENGIAPSRDVKPSRGCTTDCDSVCPGAVTFFEGQWSVHSTSVKREMSLLDFGIGPVIKKNLVVPMPPTAPALMANEKLKDIVAEKASVSGSQQRSCGRNGYE